MGNLLIDLLVSIPIGIMYNMTIHKTGDIFSDNVDYNYKVQRNLLISFCGGIVGLMIAMFVFGQNSRFKNRSIRYGLYFGSILLLMHAIMYNWETLENNSKFVIMIISLFALILYVYNNFTETEEKSRKKRNDAIDDEYEYEYDNNDGSKYLAATYVNYKPPELFGAHKENIDTRDDGIMNYY